jgi:hypothetical protein
MYIDREEEQPDEPGLLDTDSQKQRRGYPHRSPLPVWERVPSWSPVGSTAGPGRTSARQGVPAWQAFTTVVFKQQRAGRAEVAGKVIGYERLVVLASSDRLGSLTDERRFRRRLGHPFGKAGPDTGSRFFDLGGIRLSVTNFVNRTIKRMGGLLTFGLHH